jgi:hypothetical protein
MMAVHVWVKEISSGKILFEHVFRYPKAAKHAVEEYLFSVQKEGFKCEKETDTGFLKIWKCDNGHELGYEGFEWIDEGGW